MIKVGVVGVGRMGLSHLSILRPHPNVQIVGLCDASGYVLDVMHRYTGLETFSDHRALIEATAPDAVVVATPSGSHAAISTFSLEHGVDVFLEKPLALELEDGRRLVELGEQASAVTQVGYHFRFVAAFQEAKRLLDSGAIGDVYNFRVSAYGPAVLRPSGKTWRSKRSEGGGCLYDYASHVANLATFLFGMPSSVGGATTRSVFSDGVDDEVHATLFFADGVSGQLSANWSDSTQRKMSVRVEAWGKLGKISADRQECQIYLHERDSAELGLGEGWNVRYAPELTPAVRYYVRGEEYSNQLDHFVESVVERRSDSPNSFATAFETDLLLDMIKRDAADGARTQAAGAVPPPPSVRKTRLRDALLRRPT